MNNSSSYIPTYGLFFFVILLIACRGQHTTVVGDAEVVEAHQSPEPVLPYQISESMVRAIFEDSKGNFWFGRDHGGLSRYDGETFKHFTVDDGLKDNQIRTIQEDKKGNIWLATGEGLSRYDGEGFTTETLAGKIFSDTFSAEQWQKGIDDLWFNGEHDGGIYRYDGNELSVLQLPLLADTHESFSIFGTITGICHGRNDMLWIANYGGVIGYDGLGFRYINDRQFEYHVRSIFEDSKGNLWIGNNGIGVLLYDGETTTNFSEEMVIGATTGLSGVSNTRSGPFRVFAIAEDREGNIWFGDRDNGAWRFDGNSLRQYTIADGLSSNTVRSIYRDSTGEMWFGLGDGFVFMFDGKRFVKKF